MMQHYTFQQRAYLQEIRNSILMKKQNSPIILSKDEFAIWQSEHNGYFLHRGYLSIWNNIVIPEDSHEIVIEKKTTRGNAKPYLIFDNAECFREYCRNAHLLGVEAYSLLEDRFADTIKSIAKEYAVPLSSYDHLQDEVEKFVGLNFSLDDVNISCEQLYASLYNYMRRAIPQKAYAVFSAQGMLVDLDVTDFENLFSDGEDEFIKSISCASINLDKIDLQALLDKITKLIDDLKSDKNAKFDIKDRLLRQIIDSDRATGEFILYHYSSLHNRRSVWRPIVFSFQVQYSHDHGEKYLKNPVFVQCCGKITIGEMISRQLKSFRASNKKALNSMSLLASKAKEEGVYQTPLSECAENTEQIGKALSKELRTEEAKSALARALLITALEKEQMTSFYETKGDEYHE